MRLLLDTHALAWAIGAPERLSDQVRELLESQENALFVSPVSVWEMSIKNRAGKWPEVAPFLDEQLYAKLLSQLDARECLITSQHTRLAGQFEQDHRDPFDRLLVAQTICEGILLVSIDAVLDSFPITRIW
jgi:PIN domain nuclease of toxin-antitoxin system